MSASLFYDGADSYGEVPYIEGIKCQGAFGWEKPLKDVKVGEEINVWYDGKFYKAKCQKEPYFDKKGFMCIKVEKTEGLKEVVFRFAHKRAPSTLEYDVASVDYKNYISVDRSHLWAMVGGKYKKELEACQAAYEEAKRNYQEARNEIFSNTVK